MTRDPGFDVELDEEELEALLGRADEVVAPAAAGPPVLITGAGGSIGSLLTRHFARAGRRVVAVDRAEAGLFLLGLRLREEGLGHEVRLVVKDCADSLLADVADEEKIGSIVHAAAHKHVGLMQGDIGETYTNNVLGTGWLLGRLFDERRDFLLISTDKAVEPVSTMGESKAGAEKLIMTAQFEGMKRRTLRLPNLLGSAGSVAQVFRRALLRGDELLIRDANSERLYIGPGAALAAIAAAMSWEGTGLLVPATPPAISTIELARRAHRLWAGEREFEFRDVGLAAGERLSESLIGPDEVVRPGPAGLFLVEKRDAGAHAS